VAKLVPNSNALTIREILPFQKEHLVQFRDPTKGGDSLKIG
jgi:hypothetical protein